MTACPDWRSLAAHRARRGAGEPAGWRQALGHLDGCPACRREAHAADPTLMFARLGAAPAPAAADREVDDMRRAVAALRRAHRVAPAPAVAATLRPWLRAAAAAALLAGLLLASPGAERAPGGAPAVAVAVPAAFTTEELARLPVFEGLDRPGPDVYELAGDDMLVVMIVDESLDV